MNLIKFRLIIVCLIGFVCVASQVTIRGQLKSQRPLRVLIDASKYGGLWWFPQGPTFDPKQFHQGKVLADFMRSKGWEVTEVPRGELITYDKLRDVDLVVRPPTYFNYRVDEIVAYRDSVFAGTRLLLMGGGTNVDPIAEIFGVRFESRSRFGSVKQWRPHPLTANIEYCNLAWTSISEVPEGAVTLAWLNQVGTIPRPVLGYLSYGKGYVVFIGQALISLTPDHSFSGSLVNSVGQYSLEEMRQLPSARRVFAKSLVGPAPRLIEPIADATLPQPNAGEWRFDWEDVPKAASYEIVVLGASAAFPLVRATTSTSDYVVAVNEGYIADHNLRGWSWRVRAQFRNGRWGPWSWARRFDVTPR